LVVPDSWRPGCSQGHRFSQAVHATASSKVIRRLLCAYLGLVGKVIKKAVVDLYLGTTLLFTGLDISQFLQKKPLDCA
jgi:hypothetical protein